LLHPEDYATDPVVMAVPADLGDNVIGINASHFSWQEHRVNTPGNRRFRLKIDGMLRFQPGTVNLIVGATGSGKTSLLSALLGAGHPVQPQNY
jgi:ABC-type transport system involved in cytochrome bd biosynthesis fused ATPase/permease subunit